MNPAVLAHFTDKPPPRPAQRRSRHHERRIRKRLDAEQIELLVAEYAAGTPSAELGRRYGIAKSSVVQLVRQAGGRARYPRLSAEETARLVELYEAGHAQKSIAVQLGRSPSAVWHCLRRAGLVGDRQSPGGEKRSEAPVEALHALRQTPQATLTR